MKRICVTVTLCVTWLVGMGPLAYSQRVVPKPISSISKGSLTVQRLRVAPLPRISKEFRVSQRMLLQAQQAAHRSSLHPVQAVAKQHPQGVPPLQTALHSKVSAAWPAQQQWMTFPGKKQVDAVIFDLDGTLLNSLSAWEHSGSNFLRSQGFEPPAELDEQLVKMSLLDGAQLVKDLYHLSYTPEELVEMTLRPIKSHYYQDIQPMPGIPELLARLQSQGVKMAIATASYKEFAQAALTRLGLTGYFDFIITCDDVGIGKTSPRVYEVAAELLGADKGRTLVVEDALHALQTASQAGFKTAAIEEIHSAHQQQEKQAVADYYVISFQGVHTIQK